MTLFEALKFNREPLEMLISLGGKQDDLRFIDLYTEYEVMKKQGEKTTYAVAFLANKYSVSERKVFYLINERFSGIRFFQFFLIHICKSPPSFFYIRMKPFP